MINEKHVRRHFVENRIINEIYDKIQVINKDKNSYCFFTMARDKLVRDSLEKEATIHSFKMEHPEVPKKSRFNCHSHSREFKKGLKSLEIAFKKGCDNFDFNNLDLVYIQELAGDIDPKFHPGNFAKIRDYGVRVTGATWTPPYAAKLPREMEDYINSLKLLSEGTELRDKIETAIFAHLHLVRIHPFGDTNGRTARTLQNIILKKNDLVLPVIYAGARDDYYSHLDGAINDWRARTGSASNEKYKSKDEKDFYNYMAGKISESYDRILSSKN